MTNLTTPYGTTTFAGPSQSTSGVTSGRRALQATDPQGGVERIEYQGFGVPGYQPAESAPTGMSTDTTLLQYRNSFFWDKNAMQQAPGDYTKAGMFTDHQAEQHQSHNCLANPREREGTAGSARVLQLSRPGPCLLRYEH